MAAPKPRENPSIRLMSSPLRAAIVITLLISSGGLLWACLARIPIYVDGFALMLRSGNNRLLLSRTEGELNHNFSPMGSGVWPGDRELFAISRRNEEISSEHAAALAQQVLSLVTSAQPHDAGSPINRKIPEGTLLSWVDAPNERAALLNRLNAYQLSQKTLESTTRELEDIDQRLRQKIVLLQRQVATQSDFLQTIRELNARGYASRAKVLLQQTRVDDIRSEVISHEERLAANNAQLLQAEVAAKKDGAELVKALRNFSDRNLIFAEHELFITGVLAPHLTQVRDKDAVLRVSRQSPGRLPEQVPGFLSQESAQQVRPGMNVLATPSGMSRAQYGGILAQVVEMDVLPSSAIQLRQALGSEGAADELLNLIPDPIQVTVRLQPDPATTGTNKGGLKWSSTGKLPYPVRQGDLMSMQITTQKVRPISLLIPWLRQLSGASAPMLKPKRSTGGRD